MNDPIASALCSNCQRDAQTVPCESIARMLVTVPQVPSECRSTHAICPSCLDLRQQKGRHAERCELGLAGIALQCAGWATPLSEFLRKDLRTRRPRWIKLAARRAHSSNFGLPETGSQNGSSTPCDFQANSANAPSQIRAFFGFRATDVSRRKLIDAIGRCSFNKFARFGDFSFASAIAAPRPSTFVQGTQIKRATAHFPKQWRVRAD